MDRMALLFCRNEAKIPQHVVKFGARVRALETSVVRIGLFELATVDGKTV